jgi:hypothetical protein
MTHLKTFPDSHISCRSIVIRSSIIRLARWTLLHATKSLLLFISRAFTSDSMATLEEVFDGVHLLFLLFFALVGLFRQCRPHFRLNGAALERAFDELHSASLQPLHFFLFNAPYSMLSLI